MFAAPAGHLTGKPAACADALIDEQLAKRCSRCEVWLLSGLLRLTVNTVDGECA